MSFITRTSTPTARRNALCLLLAALLLFAPCARAGGMDDSLLLGMISVKTQKLNPLVPVERDFISLTNLIYEPLVTLDDNYMPAPCLAESWSTANGTNWTFRIRDNVYFHNGQQLTARDVVATLREILRLAELNDSVYGNGQYSSLKYIIKSVDYNDDLSLRITTSRAYYGLLYAMTFPVVPESQVQADNPVGTGPFVMDKFIPTESLFLTANDRWWKATPTVREVTAIFHAANRDLISSYEYNRVDAIITRSVTAAQYHSGIASANIAFRSRQLETLLMNNKATELTDVKTRKAIRYAIDADYLAKIAYSEMVTRTDTPMVPGTWMYRDDDTTFVYNQEEAKRLLAEAGWADSDDDGILDRVVNGKKANLSLRFYFYEEADNSVRSEAANRIVDMLAAVGVQARLTRMSFSEVKAKLKACNYDLILAAYQMDAVPDPGFMLMSGNTGNYSYYKSKDMDALFKTLRAGAKNVKNVSTTSEYLSALFEEYKTTLYEIQAQFAEDCPFICLYYRGGALLTRKMFTTVRDVREPDILRGIETIGNY